jgi:hypothetical protein
VFILEIDTPTHDRGNTLDLAFVSGPLALAGACTKVAEHLDATSDHHPLLTTLPWGQRHQEAPQRLKFSTLDLPRFHSLLALNTSNLPTTAGSEDELDSLADGITSAIHSAYVASALRSLPQGGGQPWWNLECKEALQKYCMGLHSQRDFW